MHSPDAAGLTGASRAQRPAAKGQAAKGRVAKRQAAIARRRAAGTLGAQASATPPLQWWRHLPAEAFTAKHLDVLRRAVAGIGMVGEPRWADAAWGHPAAAVALARRVMQERRPLTPIVDLTMSTVLLAAATAGDPDAIAVLLTMIERMGTGAETDALQRSWLGRRRKADRGRIAVLPARARSRSGG
jgi:hypothetical protein